MKKALALLVILAAGNMALRAANVATGPLAAVKAYPNPWKVDKHPNLPMTFDGMPAGSSIKIYTISAHLVRELVADSLGKANWDLKNDAGASVASGIYIYLVIDPQGNDTSGKIAVIK